MKNINNKVLPLLPLLLLFSMAVKAAEQFPVRALYPKVKTIELEDLTKQYNDVTIFDVRSSYEYNTLHIKKAKHLALNDPNFVAKLLQLRKKDKHPFVFYCNGHTCKKSYKATLKAEQGHVPDVQAFDAGIFDWTKAHPDEAVLLGKSPVNLKWLLSKDKLNAHMLAPETFGERVSDNTIVLDIRDRNQRNAIKLFPMRQHSVSLDNQSLKTWIDKAKREGKTLMVYDAVGKQVRWLQYYLEDEHVSRYYFMKGGAKAFLNY